MYPVMAYTSNRHYNDNNEESVELEDDLLTHAMPITPHANGLMANLFSSGALHITFFPSSATILLFVRSANGDG